MLRRAAAPTPPPRRAAANRPTQPLSRVWSGALTFSPRRSVQRDSSGWPYFQSMRLESAASTGRFSMRLRKMAPLLALLSLSAAPLIAGIRSEAAFKKLQSLAGEWEGTYDPAMAVKTNFQVIACTTRVMETLPP